MVWNRSMPGEHNVQVSLADSSNLFRGYRLRPAVSLFGVAVPGFAVGFADWIIHALEFRTFIGFA